MRLYGGLEGKKTAEMSSCFDLQSLPHVKSIRLFGVQTLVTCFPQCEESVQIVWVGNKDVFEV